ncbi:MAG: hypothetical protein ACLP36_17325 [Acidimicrobiales bacterium]
MGRGDSPGGPEPRPAGAPPRVSTYLYPWDVVGDPDAASRLVSAGFRHVVVAAAYHSVRAATPRHPRHRFVVAETAALYRPVRQGLWAGRRLCPLGAPWAGSEDSFPQAVQVLEAEGLGVSAWVVLTHNSALGRRQRDLVVRNCFGDSYEWALCPANEEVREYAALLSVEAVRGLALEGISLEACGQLGAEHGGHHEKSAAAYTPLASQILSICCCDACRRAWSVQGLDPGATVQALREASEVAQHEAGAGARPEDCLGAPLAAQLLACRQRHTDALLEQVHGELRDSGVRPRISLHAQSDPWATGASPGLTPASAQRAEAVLVPVDPTSARSGEVIAAARRSVPAGVKVAAYVNLLGPVEPAEFGTHTSRLIAAEPDELHLYHFGLANDRQLALFSALASMSS